MGTKKIILEKTGDGLAFYQAFKLSGKTAEDVYTAMGISNGTLYNLFNSASIDDGTKQQAVKAMDKAMDEVFGGVSKTKTEKELKQINEDSPTVALLAKAVADGNEAAKIQAIANDKTADNVTRMLNMLGAKPISSDTSVAKKMDLLFEEIQSVRAGSLATRNLLIRQIADFEKRPYEDVFREYVGNDLAEMIEYTGQGGKTGGQDKKSIVKQS